MTKKIKMVGIVFISIVLLLGEIGCSETKSDPELEKAAEVIRYLLIPKNLKRSAFSAAFDNPTPKDFVSYIFSPMGSAEWPTPMDEYEREQMQAIGAPITPANVGFNALTVSGQYNRQIVVKYDNERNKVIAEGYTDPSSDAIFVKEWELVRVKPAVGVKEMFESNKGMGLSYQSF